MIDDLDRAQSVIYDAWDAGTAKRRIALAEKALAISPLCADAHVLMAEHAEPRSDQALASWRSAVDAGKAALGSDFKRYAGSFWGFLETRPYMRARFGLARALWLRDERDEAVDHLKAMLELNPNDNQGARYVLAAWLVEMGRDAEIAALLAEYPDDGMAAWEWTAALAAFRQTGDTAASRALLTTAMAYNVHIAAYLRGERPLPKRLPPFLSPGGEDEAIYYVLEFQRGWILTPGALEWLGALAPSPKTRRAPRKAKAK